MKSNVDGRGLPCPSTTNEKAVRQENPGKAVRPRPRLFRALGHDEPPDRIEIDGTGYRRLKIFKHDSYAATALYAGPAEKIVCKFNRQESILGVPMKWLGRILARREAGVLLSLADLPGIPRACGEVRSGNMPLPHAAAHAYIEGHPLGRHERVGDDFFPQARAILSSIHRRNIAYVDLHKRENIIVGDDGRPWLIDFQIHFALPGWWPGNSLPVRALLRILQRSDDYHLLKHVIRLRPDTLSPAERDIDRLRPWWIRGWRCLSIPFQYLRRRLLVAVGVRSGRGRAETEHNPEEAVRLERDREGKGQ